MVVEPAEKLLDGFAEVSLDGRADHLRRVGRRVRAQLAQLVRHGGAELVGAGAEHLAELDEGGAQLGQRQADARLVGHLAEALAVGADEPALEPLVFQPAEPVGEAVLAEDREDLGQPARGPLRACKDGELHGDRLRRGQDLRWQ